MRYSQYAAQPTRQFRNLSNLVGSNLIARDRVLRIAEILQFLGFAENLEDVGSRFLNFDEINFHGFLAGRVWRLTTQQLDRLQTKLNIGSETTAYELQLAGNRTDWLVASSRNDLMQLAQNHFNEFREKLASSNF
ncbi:MAG: hypothetical protein ABJH63_15285 [Rhizobiaceae bacterium]